MNSYRFKRFIHVDTSTLGFQIAPMIDVVFVILLFFMVIKPLMKTLTARQPAPQ